MSKTLHNLFDDGKERDNCGGTVEEFGRMLEEGFIKPEMARIARSAPLTVVSRDATQFVVADFFPLDDSYVIFLIFLIYV